VAQWKAELVAQRPKTAKLVCDERLREYVQQRLAGEVRLPDGTASGPETRAFWGATSLGARTAAGSARGVRSRSPNG
jgi:hypothetical protein